MKHKYSIMFRLTKPAHKSLDVLQMSQARLACTYKHIGITRTRGALAGFDADHLEVLLGQGQEVFDKAKLAIDAWRMFPPSWTEIYPANKPYKDQTVVMTARFAGFHWLNTCKVVYLEDTPNNYGFAYGTLPHHVESGEEWFGVRMDDKEQVWYEILAYSRPRWWAARLAYPIMRWLQARFRRDSAANMQMMVKFASLPKTNEYAPIANSR